MEIHVFAVEETLHPIPAKLALHHLDNRVVHHGDVIDFPDPFIGQRKYLVAIVGGGDTSVSVQGKAVELVRCYHRVHPHHRSLVHVPPEMLASALVGSNSSDPNFLPTAGVDISAVLGPVFDDVQVIAQHVCDQRSESSGSINSLLITGTGDNWEQDLALQAFHSAGMTVINIHDLGGISLGALSHASKLANAARPAVLWLPDIDLLFPQQMDVDDDTYHEMCFLRSFMERRRSQVLVCAQTAGHRQLHEFIRDEFDAVLTVEKPSSEQRRELLKTRLADLCSTDSINHLAAATTGCTLVQIDAIVKTCYRHQRSLPGDRSKDELTQPEIISALRPSGFKAIAARLDSEREWQGIVGLDGIRRAIREDFAYFLTQERVLVPPPVCITIDGPSGCGKTLLCAQLGAILGVHVLAPSVTDIIRGEVGESERNIHELFESARRLSPCLIIFDDMASVFMPPQESDSMVSSGVLSQVTHEMDALLADNYTAIREQRRCVIVTAVFVSTSLSSLAPALLAPSRCFQNYTVSLPTQAQRKQLLRHFLQKTGWVVEEAQLQEATSCHLGASPAELQRFVNERIREAVYSQRTEIKLT
eukprot:m.177080 g.177080  ORF g.177080 m.177080 type:complete len:590 (-) comp16569_c0_seq7:203-1972(-)